MTYEESATWLREHWNELPQTLDGGYKYYRDVKGTLRYWAELIKSDSVTQKEKESTKHKVIMAVSELQDRSNWNKPLPEIDNMKNNYRL